MPAVRVLLFYLALSYPAYLLGSAIVHVVPRCLLDSVQNDPTYKLPPVLTTSGFREFGSRENRTAAALSAVILVLCLWPLRKAHPFAYGLLAAAMGAQLIAAGGLFGRAWALLTIFAGLLALLAAARALAAASAVSRPSLRYLWVLLALAVPPTIFFLLSFRRTPLYWWRLPLGCAVAALAALAGVGVRSVPTISWARILASALASAMIFFGIQIYAERRVNFEDEQAQSFLRTLAMTHRTGPFGKVEFQRGVSFTAESGVRYDSEAARRMLAQLPAYGINSVALIPFGAISIRPFRVRTAGPRSWESDAGIEILSALAHQQGMQVMLKPHVSPPDPQSLQTGDVPQWFDHYGQFLEHYARLARQVHADLFCIGVELGWLTRHEAEWRRIVRRIRPLYPGPLVYAANFGGEFEQLAFWDELDYIGLDNYYPLPDSYSTSALEAKVEAVHRRFGRPVIFTEAGFSAIEDARRQPWADETGGPLSLSEQARCYDALLRGFYGKPWFQGVYWWKVGTNGYGGAANSSMTPWRKPAMEVLRRWYQSGKR